MERIMFNHDRTRPGVLVVDNDKFMLGLVSEMLVLGGYQVFRADGPEQAIQVFGGHREEISLLLSDLQMPGMDGNTLSDRLCANKPELVVLIMSGKLQPDSDREILQKPFSIDELHLRVAQALADALIAL
jgi:CheY-like chemotaxis protein